MPNNVRVAVIGGGIGGLTATRALLGRGVDAHAYESSPELKEIGAGVALGPNAMKALRSLELEDAVRAVGYEAPYQWLRTWKGKTITKVPRIDNETLYGATACTVHRADLLDVLAAALPGDAVTLGARCDGVRQDGDVAVAHFVDGSEVEADVIVGADGIHSAVRASLFGPDAPRFTGKICYRSVIPTAATPAGSITPYEGLWLGPHGTIVVYGLRRGELINVVCHHDDEHYKHESWIERCETEEVLDRYRRWDGALGELFAAGDTWYKWALYDRDPIPRWTSGRATLLGDSAHPMLPYLGQGACQALEDGCVLAAALETLHEVPDALARYERLRRPRASRVVLTAREQGVDNHLVSRWAALRRDIRIKYQRRFHPGQGRLGNGWIFDYDAGSPSVLEDETSSAPAAS